jgi:hypothetical protein
VGGQKKLGTLGLPDSAPGKGARRLYSWEQANQLLLALLMEDAGLDPVVVATAIKTVWTHLVRNVKRATAEEAAANPIMLHLRLETFTAPWEARTAVPWISMYPRLDEAAKAWRIQHHVFRNESDNAAMMLDRDELNWLALRNCALRLEAELAKRETDSVLMALDRDDPGWFAVRNYTAEALKLQAALTEK